MNRENQLPVTPEELLRFRSCLRRLEREISGNLKEDTACCGVTSVQCHTLLELEQMGTVSVSRLAGHFGLDKSTMSRTVDGLLARDLISREENPEDRRSALIRLTGTGLGETEKINRECNRQYGEIFRLLPEEQHQPVISAMEILADALETLRKNRSGESCCNGDGEERS